MTNDAKPTTLTPKLRFPEFLEDPGWDPKPGDELFDQISNREAPAGLPILAITQEHGAIPRDEIDYHVSVTDKSVETYKEVRPGDFIISLRSFQGGIEYSNYHGVCSPAYVILRKKTKLSDTFFKHLFKSHSFIQQLTKNLEGLRDGKMISYKQFSELRLPSPAPAEQQKIAECLSTLDELIGAESKKIDALKAHKKGLMVQLVPRQGETIPCLRFPEFQSAPQWSKVRLGDVCEIQRGRFSHRPRNDPQFFGGNYPFIQTGDVVSANGGAVSASQSLNEKGLLVSKLFKPTIVLITIAANIGDTALLTCEACFTDSVVGLIPRSGISPYFLELAVRGKKEFLNKIAPQNAQKNINNEILRELEILKPQQCEQQEPVRNFV